MEKCISKKQPFFISIHVFLQLIFKALLLFFLALFFYTSYNHWMLNENVPLPSNSENNTDVENGFVHNVVVETGPDIPKQSEVMNEQNEDLKTINQTFETSRDCETETLLSITQRDSKRLKNYIFAKKSVFSLAFGFSNIAFIIP